MRIDSTPTSRRRAAVSSAEKPPPMNRTSTSSSIGSRVDDLLDVGVGRVASEVARELGGELRRALRPVGEAEVALLGEPLLDLVVVLLRTF